MIRVRPAMGADDLADVCSLLRLYAAGLAIDLSFQDFEVELATLPGRYRDPAGALLLAEHDGYAALGCVGIRPLDEGSCEMKRLFVRPEARGTGAGHALAQAAITFGRRAGYDRLYLDTLPSMVAATALYRRLGFREVAPYWAGSLPDTLYFCRSLRDN